MAQSRPSVWRGPTGAAVLAAAAFLLDGSNAGASSAQASQIQECPVPAGSSAISITTGEEGDLWFTAGPSTIGRITPAGEISLYPTSAESDGPITTGPDGNLWSCGESIGRTTPSGVFNGLGSSGWCLDIAPGPGGDLWFTDHEGPTLYPPKSYIGRVTPDGTASNVELPKAGQEPQGLALGPEGDLWITERGGYDNVKVRPAGQANVLRMSPQGAFTEFPLPDRNSRPGPITAGPDGNLWYVDYESRIGRVTPNGEVTEFSLPRRDIPVNDITAGPEGNLWFTGGENIGLITPAGAVTQYPEEVHALSIATGPEGNVWFTEPRDGVVGRITPGTVGIGFGGTGATVHKGKVRLTLFCGGGTPGEPCRGKIELRLAPAKKAGRG